MDTEKNIPTIDLETRKYNDIDFGNLKRNIKLLLDIETTTIQNKDKPSDDDPSPYLSTNRLVSVGYYALDMDDCVVYGSNLYFNHTELRPGEAEASKKELDYWLSRSIGIIGHNLKFDLSWLLECGFTYRSKLWDTMLFEYIMACGQKPDLKLGVCAAKYGLEPKKDILHDYLEKRVNTDEVPREELEEYGMGDIETTYQLYLRQRELQKTDIVAQTTKQVWELSGEALACLIDMERAGVRIDRVELQKVEDDYRKEKAQLENDLNMMVKEVMGAKPYNINSPDDMIAVIYGLKVNDKSRWKETFNIGKELRGSVLKEKRRKRFKDWQFRNVIKEQTTQVMYSEAQQCPDCGGRGYIQKYNKNGSPSKRLNVCHTCDKKGVIYPVTLKRAGFRIKPIDYEYASASGFATDKDTIEDLLTQDGVSLDAQVFLKNLSRYNKISTYLDSFVEGIKNNIRTGDILHVNFNQCITATGRLSSSRPNFQNQPRGDTFPVRRCIISRWKGGKILESDFAALEYRVAVALAKCPAGTESILSGKDRHQITTETMMGKKKEDFGKEEWKILRQDHKKDTFGPLFGKSQGSDRLRKYIRAFFKEHTGIYDWHQELLKEACATKQIVTPLGRVFKFPYAEYLDEWYDEADEDGWSFRQVRATSKTQIVNYPVQSTATADVAWCVIVDLWKSLKEHNLQSKLVLQVHDSVAIDVHPDEIDIVTELAKKSFDKANELVYNRFSYETPVPIGYEMAIRDNWLDKKEVA